MPAPGELTVAVAACPRVGSGFGAAPLGDALPAAADLLVVEPGATAAGASLTVQAARLGVPSAAWLRAPSLAAEVDLAPYDAVFVTDPALAEAVESRTGRRAAPLPDAASREALAAVRAGTPEPWIALAPGGADDKGFARLLTAARGHETRELPDDPAEAAAMLSRCAALLATHAAGASQLHLPGAVFDAVAMRTPVVVPANRGAALLLPGIVPRAVGPKQAAQFVAAAVAQHAGPEVGARVIRHAHTYAHRLATLASALGLRVLPAAV